MKNNWRAGIVVNTKELYLGFANTAEKAAIIYNDAAIKYFGEFALLNNIKGDKNV